MVDVDIIAEHVIVGDAEFSDVTLTYREDAKWEVSYNVGKELRYRRNEDVQALFESMSENYLEDEYTLDSTSTYMVGFSPTHTLGHTLAYVTDQDNDYIEAQNNAQDLAGSLRACGFEGFIFIQADDGEVEWLTV